MCNVSGVARSNEPAEKYHPTLQLPSALQIILGPFSSLFWLYSPNFTVLVHSHS